MCLELKRFGLPTVGVGVDSVSHISRIVMAPLLVPQCFSYMYATPFLLGVGGGVRGRTTKAAQDLARRAIRTERSRTEKLVAAAQKEFERKKKALVAQREREEEDWKAERCEGGGEVALSLERPV